MKIGFGLQDALLKKAKELNFDQMWLSVLHTFNETGAISLAPFYKQSGFEHVGHHDFQIGKERFEFIAMNKQL